MANDHQKQRLNVCLDVAFLYHKYVYKLSCLEYCFYVLKKNQLWLGGHSVVMLHT